MTGDDQYRLQKASRCSLSVSLSLSLSLFLSFFLSIGRLPRSVWTSIEPAISTGTVRLDEEGSRVMRDHHEIRAPRLWPVAGLSWIYIVNTNDRFVGGSFVFQLQTQRSRPFLYQETDPCKKHA